MCRLETIQRSVLPWQKEAIERMTPMVVSLVNDTQQAIVAVTKDQGRLFASSLRRDVTDMYKQARNIDSSAYRDVEYAKTHNNPRQMKGTSTASGA